MIWWTGYLIIWFIVGALVARYMIEDQRKTHQISADDQIWAGLAGLSFGAVWPFVVLSWIIGQVAMIGKRKGY